MVMNQLGTSWDIANAELINELGRSDMETSSDMVKGQARNELEMSSAFLRRVRLAEVLDDIGWMADDRSQALLQEATDDAGRPTDDGMAANGLRQPMAKGQ